MFSYNEIVTFCTPCTKIFDTTIMNPESILVRLLTQKHVKNELSVKSMIHFMHEFYSVQYLQDPFHPLSNFQVILIYFNIFFAPKTMKKQPQKLLIIGTNLFFSVMPTSPKPAQISGPDVTYPHFFISNFFYQFLHFIFGPI